LTQLLTRRAAIGPSSLDVEARTAEAIVVTSAPVKRSGQRPDGSHGFWLEVLDLDGASLERLIGGPILVDHDHHRGEARIGVVEAVRREGSQLVAKLRFSDREEVAALLRDLAAGIGGAISVGYFVEEWRSR
jgi:hypothetical protein